MTDTTCQSKAVKIKAEQTKTMTMATIKLGVKISAKSWPQTIKGSDEMKLGRDCEIGCGNTYHSNVIKHINPKSM